MSDDLRDKFDSDEDYDSFRNSFNDYKRGSGMFDSQKQIDDYIKTVIRIEELMYKNFVLEKKKYFRLPDEIFNAKYMSLYIFYFEKLLEYNETTMIFLN